MSGSLKVTCEYANKNKTLYLKYRCVYDCGCACASNKIMGMIIIMMIFGIMEHKKIKFVHWKNTSNK